MADTTEIAWTDSTFNPWIGCTKVGPGCDNCYAEADFDLRKHRAKWGAGQPRSRTAEANWRNPMKWERQHAEFFSAHGRRRRVFCASLADVFDNEVPAEWRRDLFDLIELTPNLDWLLLTKRIGNVQRLVREVRPMDWLAGRRNVWLGATICNQEEADRDIQKLLAVPAAVRFLSVEPLLGPISLRWLPAFPENAPHTAQHPSGRTDHLDGLRRLDWVIVGGESGPHARPMQAEWVENIKRQCEAAGVAFFFKQWGGRVDKGGCLLDGAEIKQWPTAA